MPPHSAEDGPGGVGALVGIVVAGGAGRIQDAGLAVRGCGDERLPAAARQHSGEDARVPAVETTALLSTEHRGVWASRPGGLTKRDSSNDLKRARAKTRPRPNCLKTRHMHSYRAVGTPPSGLPPPSPHKKAWM